MPFAGREGLVALWSQYFRDVSSFPRNEATGIGKAIVAFGYTAYTDTVMVATRQKAGSGGGTQWCHMEIGIAQAVIRQAVQRRRLDI